MSASNAQGGTFLEKGNNVNTIQEPARETKVSCEADVVVVGGGPGGIAAALSAARSGAHTVLIERYGYLGGMATGGLVNIIPNLSDIFGKQHIAGICQEIIDRMDARDAAHYPAREEWGTADRKVVDRYLDAAMPHFYIRKDFDSGKDRAGRRSSQVHGDPVGLAVVQGYEKPFSRVHMPPGSPGDLPNGVHSADCSNSRSAPAAVSRKNGLGRGRPGARRILADLFGARENQKG